MSNVIDVYHNTINWDKLTDLWEYLYFDELQVDPENHPVCCRHSNLFSTLTRYSY